MKKHLAALVLTAALLPALAACGDDDSTAGGAAPDGTAPTRGATTAAGADVVLTLTDAWVKAVPGGMTGAFGTLVNEGPDDVTVVGASTDTAGTVELHETVQNADGSMAMQPREGGFTVPAGGTHVLAPGGDHIMLMGLSGGLEPGTTVELVLTLDDGTTSAVTATVKAFDGADEKYQNGGGH